MARVNDYELFDIIKDAFRFQPNYGTDNGGKRIFCKCHICGDSMRDKNQARLNSFVTPDGEVMVKCFNCDYSSHGKSYLYDYHPALWEKYRTSFIKQNLSGKVKEFEEDEEKIKEKVKELRDKNSNKTQFGFIVPEGYEKTHEINAFVEPEENESFKFPKTLPNVYRLDLIAKKHPNHAIVEYVRNRMIPTKHWNRLFYTGDFRRLVNEVKKEEVFKNLNYKEPRLVIPIYNENKEIEAFQGRALRKRDSNIKYMTIKLHELSTKIYGLDIVDPNKTAFFLEGPLDSLFVDNGLAITGGAVSVDKLPFKNNRAFIMDNEPRHKDTIPRIEKLIKEGESIVLFDKVNWKSKDINEILLNGEATLEEINDYIQNNVVSGFEAMVRFNNWSGTNSRTIFLERMQERRVKKKKDNFLSFIESKIG